MKTFDATEWQELIEGYDGKKRFDHNAKRNMDVYRGDVFNEIYLPRYSLREGTTDYSDRLNRSKNSFFNFSRKVLNVYSNSIFRSTEPTRSTNNADIENFLANVDGNKTGIGKFTKNKVFVLEQITGGCLIVIDKPPVPVDLQNQTITRRQQEQNNLFPYAYVLPWEKLVNYKVDEFGKYNWVILDHGTDGNDQNLYKIWDKSDWWIADPDQKVIASGSHNLNAVPVIPSIAIGDPKYNFNQPISPFDDITRITLKIFEAVAMLDEMIISHIWLKLAMPQSMFDKIRETGAGNYNVLIFPDGYQGDRAYYIETPGTEIKTLIDLIFDKYPRLLLEMATIRSKTDKPREESGSAKFIDSSDELANLTDKAESMELAEQRMIDLYAIWESIADHNTTISYSKSFDVKPLNQMIEEMISIFKEDLQSPTFSREITKRVTRKMLGNVDAATWANIESEIDDSMDPALNLDDAEKLVSWGAINVTKYAMRYNPEIETEEQALQFIAKNLDIQRGSTTDLPNFDQNGQ